MTLIGGIIFLGIVIGVARAYPKTSILIAIILLIIFINRDSEPTPEKQTNISKSIENSSSSNRIQKNPSNYYRLNTLENKSNNHYTPSIETSSKTKINNVKVRIGAVCNDGSTSRATGRGACSHHGGVDYWLYE